MIRIGMNPSLGFDICVCWWDFPLTIRPKLLHRPGPTLPVVKQGQGNAQGEERAQQGVNSPGVGDNVLTPAACSLWDGLLG